MLSKIVLICVGAVLALCHASDIDDTIKANMAIFHRPADNRTRVVSRSGGFRSTATTSAPIITSTTSKTTTPLDDTDYFDENFQPYKVDSTDFFDWRFIGKVFVDQKTNVIISPFSVKLVLAILSEGANGNSATKQELDSILYRKSSPIYIREEYKKMLQSLKETNINYTLNLATKMYIRNNITPRKHYATIIKTTYDTDIEVLNFSDAWEAANSINKWCSNVTQGHLENLVTSDNVQNANLLLINAIYFEGKWRSPFTESFTSVFFRQPLEQTPVDYVQVTDKFYYFHSTMLNAKVLRLPYKGRKFSMTVILPGAKGGIEELVREIEGDQLRRIQWLMTEQKVKVTMPKFKFEFTAHLKDTLMALGINDIFQDSSDLSAIVDGNSAERKIKVTNIIQKAGIEVDEAGSKVFAATDVEIVNKFGGDEIEEFNVNRPFIFIINDEPTNNIIFAGKVLDPTY